MAGGAALDAQELEALDKARKQCVKKKTYCYAKKNGGCSRCYIPETEDGYFWGGVFKSYEK